MEEAIFAWLMSFAKKKTRVISDTKINANADVWKEPGEKFDIYGPFDINGRKYAIAAYYPVWEYRWRFVRNFFPVMLSIVWKATYHRQKNIDELLNGIRVYDSGTNPVPLDKGLYVEAYRTTKIWLRVFFNPFYPPSVKPFEAKLKLVKRIAETLRKAGYPEPKTKTEAFYVEELRRANQQVCAHIDILERHNRLLTNIVKSFNDISDKSSSTRTRELHSQAIRFKSILEEMANWCEIRAKSWNDFVDAFAGFRAAQEDKMNPAVKYGPRAVFDGMLGVLAVILSGGSVALGTGFSVASDFGFQYLRDLVMRPKWQAKSLMKVAKLYRITISGIDSFLNLYSANPDAKLVFRVQS